MKMQARRPRRSRCLPATLVALALAAAFLVGAIAGCGKKEVTKPSQAPIVRVLTPNGGERFLTGMQTEITWTATDGDTPTSDLRITIEFSPDGGAAWQPVAFDDTNSGVCAWAIPMTTTGQGIIRVTVTDGVHRGSDVSDTPFSISSTPPPLRNTIAVGDGSAVSGATVELPFSLQNEDTAGLIEARVLFDPAAVDFRSVRLTGRGAGMQILSLELGTDTVKVTLQQQNGIVIAPGDGPVALLAFRVIGAGGTVTDLRLRQAVLLDAAGTSLGVRTQDGVLTILMVDAPEVLTAAGWAAFEAGALDLALQKFDAAIGLDAQHGPAYTGRGWVQLSRATTLAAFRTAVSSFDDAMGRGQVGADVHGGRAAARLALGGVDLAGAVQDAQAALAASPDFVFPHRIGFDSRDLHLLAAFAEAGRGGRFTEALSEADRVQDSGIDLGDPQTWTVDGVSYPTPEGAVLAWLHKLSAAFAG